ncbi:hypothetical protein BUALT_Bualt04G0062600 [Buddleja alternifolia]|uniref:Uncharacterized protein n=1 Tax=Buddleja alternifolia TaxID=168488 RepID=A0AAV6XN33_9LAMI|nr:hypothetical protein BUALT_Bualt04G0062600 [Buddleja alternifolia]
MAFSIPRLSSTLAIISPNISNNILPPFVNFPQFSKTYTSFGCRTRNGLLCCYAAPKQQQKSGATKKKKKPSSKSNRKNLIEDDDFEIEKSGGGVEVLESPSQYAALPLPKPPAGFVLDEQGRVLMASNKRIATIFKTSLYNCLRLKKWFNSFPFALKSANSFGVNRWNGDLTDDCPIPFDLENWLRSCGPELPLLAPGDAPEVDSTNNFPLECVIRRVFRNSWGDECMLLCPVDTPVQILKSVNVEGWAAVSDEEVEAILPTAAYALAKIHMHLVYSGFCYTARGGFCYSEEDIFEFHIDNGEDVDGLPTEGIEIACFHLDGSHYMIYTPSDPLLFVAVKNKNGALQIADDELLEDPAIISAIDEETEFNALVEEEAALLESLIGKR